MRGLGTRLRYPLHMWENGWGECKDFSGTIAVAGSPARE